MRNALSVALLAATLASCASNQPYLTHEPSKDSVAEFTAPKGSTYTAELPFSAGTGYAWTASRFDEKIVKLEGQSSRRAHHAARGGGPMGGGMRVNHVGKGEAL
ncbi:MAG: hypothetical protein ACK5C3_01535, partial [bacterium]